jgi:hypothetical protein
MIKARRRPATAPTAPPTIAPVLDFELVALNTSGYKWIINEIR